MTLSLPLSAQVELWRQKVKDGTITTEELREAVRTIREGRVTASATKTRVSTAKGGRRVTDVDPAAAEDLLKELGDM
jgi:hypothetical protein